MRRVGKRREKGKKKKAPVGAELFPCQADSTGQAYGFLVLNKEGKKKKKGEEKFGAQARASS